MNKKLIATALASFVSVSAFAAETVHLYIKAGVGAGAKILRDDWIIPTVKSPRDIASGLATGRRQHEPVVFRRAFKNDLNLQQALCTNEVLPEVEFTFDIKSPNAKSKSRKAKLVSPKLEKVSFVREGNTVYEEVSFTYQKIDFSDL